jgi:NAD(P)-dependent dehydrogenase (short-subunit alcohol dehydrogenase family)
MARLCDGRVAIVTGGARGVGREHCLMLAEHGAKVVVNDLGGDRAGKGHDVGPAQQVVNEIKAKGGEAVANGDDVSDWNGAKRMIDQAVSAFGKLDAVVLNAGILRDRMLVNMTEDEWDAVVKVHLKGHFAPLHHAAVYWRDQVKAGHEAKRAVVNTSSTSGLFGNIGQTNYGAAKMGIGALTIIASQELSRYGVRVNAIAPAALTRLTAGLAGADRQVEPDPAEGPMAPGNVSPFVAYLSTEHCPINGRVFFVMGGQVHLFQPWAIIDKVETEGRWTVEDLEIQAAKFAEVPFDLGNPMGG